MTNNEVFYTCVLTGAKEILGVENPVEGLDKETVKKEWKKASKKLYEKKIIYDKDDEIYINDKYAKISAAISYPELVYIHQIDEDTSKYIYIKRNLYVSLITGENFEVKLFENVDEFIEELNQNFHLTDCKEFKKMEFTSEEINKALELFVDGEKEKAIDYLKSKDVNKEEIGLIIELMMDNENYIHKDFIGIKTEEDDIKEAIFKTIKTKNGTWLLKILDDKINIFKYNKLNSLLEVLNI
ncbi:MAG: hypothetical protein ACLFMO_03645 [Eubacteriales bacterium]